MAKTKISEFSTTAGNNTDINSINIAEGCAPSGINDAIRELMRQLKEFQTGGAGDSVNSGGDFSVATNKFTVASASGNTAVAGTLGATGDFAVNTNKFTVAASSGNTAVAGTFAVTGATTLTGALVANGNSTLGDADTDTVTLNASFVNGTTLKTAKSDTNTLALAAYDVDGTAYTNLVTLTAGNTPTLALTSTGVGTINNMSIGATTASTGAFTTLSASGNVTLSGGTANGVLYLNGSKVATAGTALTFDGTNLGVGTASPVFSNSGTGLMVNGTTAGTVRVTQGGGTQAGEFRADANNITIGSRTNGSLIFEQFGSEAMRLTSTGLGIGTSSPAGVLEVIGTNGLVIARSSKTASANSGSRFMGGAYTGNPATAILLDGVSGENQLNIGGGTGVGEPATSIRFYIGTAGTLGAGTERARIDSSGNLLVGRTAAIASERLCVEGSNTTFISRIRNTSATTPAGLFVSYTAAAPNDTGNLFFRADDNAATRTEIRSNGGIANYSGNNVNLSDRREKTNFAPAGEYLSKICAIPVQTFNYIDQNMEDDPGLTLGVVAQDVQAVAPELVMESNWGTEEEPKMRLSIYQTDLQYALMKCIQEQQAQIESLRKRLADAGIA